LIRPVPIATRSGQVVLYELTDLGRGICSSIGIDPGKRPRASLEHRYWVKQTARQFEKKGYDVTVEHAVPGNGAIDVLAQRPGQRVAIEIETGKSDIEANLTNALKEGFDQTILVATRPEAVRACQKAIDDAGQQEPGAITLLTWLDVS